MGKGAGLSIMRITKDEMFIQMARTLAKATTCLRRGVGCVLVDNKHSVIATGYNGVARGQAHCNQPTPIGYQYACKGAFAESGKDLDLCEAIHAEQNALLQCADVDKIHICYVTTSPCVHCMKLLMNTGCKIIVTDTIYSEEAVNLWKRHGGEILLSAVL